MIKLVKVINGVDPAARIRELALRAYNTAEGGGPEAYAILVRQIRADAELLDYVLEKALHACAQMEIAVAARVMRSEIVDVANGYAPRGRTGILREFVHAMKLRNLPLPVDGTPLLHNATCEQAWKAVEYYEGQAAPFVRNAKFLRLVLAGRRDGKLLPAGTTEKTLQAYWTKATERAT